jgi:hypothetical protein
MEFGTCGEKSSAKRERIESWEIEDCLTSSWGFYLNNEAVSY